MSILTDRLRNQLACWTERYEVRLEEVASVIQADAMAPALANLEEASSICHRLHQLVQHREYQERAKGAQPASGAPS